MKIPKLSDAFKASSVASIAQSKGVTLADKLADNTWNELRRHVSSFGLTPQQTTIDRVHVSLRVVGLNPRFWTHDDAEHTLSSWLPTVSLSAGALPPALKFKYATAKNAEKAYDALVSALKARSINSMGDIHQVVASVSSYKWNHGSVDGMTWSEKSAQISDRTLKEISAAADRALEEMARKPRINSQALLASRLSSINLGPADGTVNAVSLLRRSFRAMRHEKTSTLQTRLETLTELTLDEWIGAMA